ncbi:MAG: Sir2 family NAD-dependent protein deacetylase, partial [Candidatus Thorarchaeota archaeon]
TPHAFAKNPQLVWEWYSWRMGIILNKEPNEAHYSLVKLSNSGLLQWIITQNVDSLHQRAGSLNILEVHGNIFRTKCEICSYKTTLQSPPKDIPKCQCGNNLRPDVVWFGETLNQQIISQAYDLITNACEILLVVGTSGVVYPIADFPFIAKRYNAFIIEFNVDTTPISIIADYTILGKAEETLPIFTETILKEL